MILMARNFLPSIGNFLKFLCSVDKRVFDTFWFYPYSGWLFERMRQWMVHGDVIKGHWEEQYIFQT